MILRIASWSSLSLNNWQELSPDSEIFRYVSSGVLIALDMMETQDGRESFGRLADQFDRYALGSRNFGNDLLQAGEFVREYFSRLRAEFPVMLVDYDMPANMSANIQRLPWPGDFGSFNPASQVVFLNGSVSKPPNPLHFLTVLTIPSSSYVWSTPVGSRIKTHETPRASGTFNSSSRR